MNSQKKFSLEHHVKTFLLDAFTQSKLANPKLVVAFSGGLDSTVLLQIFSKINKTLPFQLSAHHVHHGLSKNAGKWLDFCQQTCLCLNVPFTLSKVNINKNSGLGVEATAREARYKALLSTDAQFVCLAHHQDDQAETLLLQLARGAGVKGLAGMPIINGKLMRPLLHVPRSHLKAYAKQHQLTWIEDESNADTTFDRNFIRHEILPKLEKKYPAIKHTISRSAQHMSDANELLDELALIDAIKAGFDANKKSTVGLRSLNLSGLNLSALKNLSENRVNNCLRWWLAQNGLQMPSATQLQQISQQLFHAKSDANIELKVSESLTLKRCQNRAYLVQKMPPNPPIDWLWQGEAEIVLPNQSRLTFSKIMGEGLSLRKIENASLRIQFREGGERFKPDLNRPRRSLKVILQNHEMPPWQREQLPLIFMNDTLVVIPNIGVDASLQAGNDEMGLVVNWI
ncbi:MAG: tRNA lysidine(34) synthetase TilS [Bdellovibrio sp.]|nr:tRNA lysidine(34) synthetase TilS [Methylotenera sp.]